MENITDQEWESRILCSDESCIGVIGPDGRCKECGLPYRGELPDGFSDRTPSEQVSTFPGVSSDDAFEDDTEPNEAPDDQDAADGDDWGNRVLCRDESCIGVIGPDGRCKECGLLYTTVETPEE